MEDRAGPGPPGHIVFVGGMATGKTSAARGLAALLGRPVYDSDVQIAHAHGETSREVAEHLGVGALHQAEAEHLLEALASPEPSVIAAAASVVDGDRCLEGLRSARVVWLRAEAVTAASRMSLGDHRRLTGADVEDLAALADRRAPRYREVADLVVDTDALDVEEVVEKVLAWLPDA